jgi:hypothetical protein
VTTAPLFTVASSSSANHLLLRHLAEGSGGAHINLSTLSTEDALGLFGPEPYSFLGAEFAEGSIEGLYPARRSPVAGRVHVSGRLLVDSAEVVLIYGRGEEVYRRIPVTLRREGATDTGLVGRFWAQQEVAELSADPKPDKARLLELGRQYGIVTPGASLLVLETLAQHVEHDVRPPESRPELLKAWMESKATVARNKAVGEKSKLESVVQMWESRVEWWETDFSGWEKKQKDRADVMLDATGEPMGMIAESGEELLEMEDSAPSPMRERSNRAARTDSGGANQKVAEEDGGDSGPSISVTAWDPKTPYMAALKAAGKKNKAYDTYLAQRPGYLNSPAYFLDCASYFYNQSDKATGRRILSSILDLGIDDPALLRVVAYRLAETDDMDLAVMILEEVKELRPEEPQSYRDLALMLSRRAEGGVDSRPTARTAQDLNQAMGLLLQVVMGNWDRFPEIEVIALMELNRLFAVGESLSATIQADLNRPALDPRLQKLLEVDVRISMVWDADLTDIDLWVLEPTQEKAYYSNPRTAIGGLVSRDFTQGYGPEEYVLRVAVPGEYTIQANYYGSSSQTLTGPATVKAVVFTDWGRPNQKRQELTLRLDAVRSVVDVGKVRFGD